MEAKFGGKGRHHKHLCGPVVGGKKSSSLEWDLNDWRWDGDLCIATPLSSHPAPALAPAPAPAPNCCSSLWDEREERDSEKRRRDAVVVGENNGEEEKGLKLGGQAYPIIAEEGEVKAGKKSKVVGTETTTAAISAAAAAAATATTGLNSGRSAVCQVEDCRADLTNAKDYHRRHKVCDMHSKASKALVGSIMQRFCQQCSR